MFLDIESIDGHHVLGLAESDAPLLVESGVTRVVGQFRSPPRMGPTGSLAKVFV
jgi:hypothetical protein